MHVSTCHAVLNSIFNNGAREVAQFFPLSLSVISFSFLFFFLIYYWLLINTFEFYVF